jgi:hypothetical protein
MLNLIRRLPPDSELSKEAHGISLEEASWSRTDHLLAIVADHLAIGNWLFASANSDKAPDRPTPIPRPGSEPESVAASSAVDQAAFFAS